MVNTVIRVTRTRPISKSGILAYPGFPICRVLHHPPLGLPCTPWSPFDPSGTLVPPVFLQLSFTFFNQHIQCGFYPVSRLSQHVLLPHANLRVVGLDHPVAQFIGKDHVLALGHLGLTCVHQNLLVHELYYANGEHVRVELHIASITWSQSTIIDHRLYLSLKIIAFIIGMSIRIVPLTICLLC
jgi:hypothetical protein